MLMSFVGSVGKLMSNTGLEDVLWVSFVGLPKLLNGNKFPQNVRALRLLAEEILGDVIGDTDSIEN